MTDEPPAVPIIARTPMPSGMPAAGRPVTIPPDVESAGMNYRENARPQSERFLGRVKTRQDPIGFTST